MCETHGMHNVSAAKPLEGIGGWLILMGIGQVLGPFQIASGMIQEYSDLPEGTIGMFPLAFVGDLGLRLAFIGLLIYTAWLFFNKRVEFPRLFIVSYAASLALPIVMALWVTLASGVNTFANFTGSVLGYYALGAAVGAIWVGYVLNSERVRNTFVH